MTDTTDSSDPAEAGEAGEASETGDANAGLEFEEGRYLYCAVRADDDASFSAEGIEDGTASLLVRDGIGVVAQPVDSVYDSDDVRRVRSWLLAHQQVVDEAGERFGTPLPFRFDTIVKGDDATVHGWLDERRGEIADALEWLEGRWEYRIEVRWNREAVRESVLEEDEELRELATRTEDASEGTGFLLEKQYERRLEERLQERRDAIAETLFEGIEPHAVEVQRSGGGSGSEIVGTGVDDDLEGVVQLSVLAPRENEEAIGERLESIAERPAYEVRYTGPWPPYSYAPSIGGDEG
jgi:hypothetical protein